MQSENKPQNMKKFFVMLALWFLTIVCVIVGTQLYAKHQGEKYTKTAVPYIKQVIPEISNWNPEITSALMAPEVLETIPADPFVRAMTWFSKLGAFQGMEEPVFKKLYDEEETDEDVDVEVPVVDEEESEEE